MAEMNNFSEINENFDTIKTLLNSIRAQGILNTSDVDKLLNGINSKLEKINTEEDIDLIKTFLTELKRNLDERHNVLVSKFGAIESLFSNLLKNSSESVKTTELKELFDIVATNLSVFSREVVAQKESLTDITLRLDAISSDETKKNDIIKSVISVKNDIERLNNGFDTIVLSLNENFKTVLKSISEVDQSEAISGFSKQITDIVNSSSAILSAIQLIDKKNNQLDDAVTTLATQKDTANIQRSLTELSAKSRELADLVDTISQKTYKIDNLADKIDASVSIIAGLKTEISDKDDEVCKAICEKLESLEKTVKEVSDDAEFEEFKLSLTTVLNDINASFGGLKTGINDTSINIEKLREDLKSLDINVSLNEISSGIVKVGEEVKEKLVTESEKVSQLFDINIQRAINDISANAENLNSKIKDTQTTLSDLFEKSFSDVNETISGLKSIVSQLDDNNVSANNAIFSNITDRLTVFENSLKESLDKQEEYVSSSSVQLSEQIGRLGKITENMDYKMDASVIELNNTKREYEELKTAINGVLGLDFVNVVKDLRIDLYAVKQDLVNAVDNSESNINEKITSDLFGKYELLVSKLDSVEDEIKIAQTNSINEIKSALDNISSSVIDVLSYVSVLKDPNNEKMEERLSEVVEIVKDSNLNYVENVRDIVDVIRTQVENNLSQISQESELKINKLTNAISESNTLIQNDIKKSYDKLVEVQSNFDEIKGIISTNKSAISENMDNVLTSAENLRGDFDLKISVLKNIILDKITEFKNEFSCENADKINELKFNSESLYQKSEHQLVDIKEDINNQIQILTDNIHTFDETVNKLSYDTTSSLTTTLSKILDNFVTLKNLINNSDEKTTDGLKSNLEDIKSDFAELRNRFNDLDTSFDEDLARQVNIIEGSFESLNLMIVDVLNQGNEALGERIKKELSNASSLMGKTLSDKLDEYKVQIENLFETSKQNDIAQSEFITNKVSELNNLLNETLSVQNENSAKQIEDIASNLKDILSENIELTAADYESLKQKLTAFSEEIEKSNENLVNSLREELNDINKYFDSGLDIQAQEIKAGFEELSANLQKISSTFRENANDISEKVSLLQSLSSENFNDVKGIISEDIKPELINLNEKIQNVFEETSLNLISAFGNAETQITEELKTRIADFKEDFAALNNRLDKDEVSQMNLYQSQIKELASTFTSLAEDMKESAKAELSSAINVLSSSSKKAYVDLESSFDSNVTNILSAVEEASQKDLRSTELIADKILEQAENIKQNSTLCKELITKLLNEQFEIVGKNIEKETDVIVSDLIEQFSLLKDFEKDELSSLLSSLEGSVAGYVLDAVNDLKSYFDVRTDSTVMNAKLDNLAKDLQASVEETSNNINKLLEVSVFSDAITDLKATNTVLIDTMAEKLNTQIQEFIKKNVSVSLGERINLFDKKFTDTITDKYEEIKLSASKNSERYDKIESSLHDVVSQINITKDEVKQNLNNIYDKINNSIDGLKSSFADLKAQILNKSFDEAFHASVKNQIRGIEELIENQSGYLEDISELCCNNLPELTEMNTIVKYGIQQSISDLKEKLENQEVNVSQELDSLKTDIITQFLNIFNQISFVTEQEEILDYIQEKHSELITILSHIVTTSDGVETVKDNLAVVDNKMDSLKEDIQLINEKITAIMSSEGDIDYVYSLQDLESDIANLRIVLNEMKDNMPNFEAEEFRKEFASIAEDIVSISTRTNKLILASDESYKTLQDNLQDFRLVIDDLDERTRNFAQESGIDKMNQNLSSMNTMIKNSEKTNKAFNQVFEYLAEWIDKAGVQIADISDKVETLNDIGQIKVMLEDLKAESADNTENEELIEGLGTIFEKQAKRIASLEAKLDRMIVDNTINSKNNKIDLAPIEDTLNRFLVAIDGKMASQQQKIDSLESKLAETISLMDNKDTIQLTKKVGGMDKQLAKLNKSIEKIASNVVEK